MKTKYYKIKKKYDLKGLPVGFYVYSRHILGLHLGHIKCIGPTRPVGKELRNLRCYRVSRGFATRRGAIRAAANLKRKSDAIILPMVRVRV